MNPNKVVYDVVNLQTILDFVARGKLNPAEVITMKQLRESGAIGKKIQDGVKLLGKVLTYFKYTSPLYAGVFSPSERGFSLRDCF